MTPNLDNSSGHLSAPNSFLHWGWGAAGACQEDSLLVTQSKINLGRSARNLGSGCLWSKSVCHRHRFTVELAMNWERRESLRNQAPWLHMTLQSYGHQTGMVLAGKQTHRPVEQKREPRNRARCIWSIHLCHRRQGYMTGKRQPVHQVLLEKLNSYMQKDQTGPFSYTKMD